MTLEVVALPHHIGTKVQKMSTSLFFLDVHILEIYPFGIMYYFTVTMEVVAASHWDKSLKNKRCPLIMETFSVKL